MRRLLLPALLLGVIFACVTTTLRPTKKVPFRVENYNWQAATLIFECRGSILHTVHQIETGARHQGEVDLRNCENPRFAVRLLSVRDVYISPTIQAWNRGEILDIRIENNIHLTSFMKISR